MTKKTPEKKMPKTVISLSIDEEVNKEIEEMAGKLGLSKSQLVNMMLRGCIYQEAGELIGTMLGGLKTNRRRATAKTRRAVAG